MKAQIARIGVAVANMAQVSEDGFVHTQDALEIGGVCEAARTNRKLAVVVGYPGAGKTFTLDRYVSRSAEAILIRANGSMSAAGLMMRIGQQLGLGLRNGQSLDYMVDAIVVELRRQPRLLIVDEADYLCTRTSLRKIELLRTIYDEAQVGMVLCGMPRLLDALTAGPTMRENLAQMYSRVAFMRQLHGFSEPEIRAFCRNHELEEDAFQLLFQLANHEQRGGLRRLGNLVHNAAFLAQGKTIKLKHVKAAAVELELTRQ